MCKHYSTNTYSTWFCAIEIVELLDDINKRGTTVIMATHAKDIVDTMKKRVIAIEDGKIARDEVRGGYGYDD